jgi:hypothetical protein
VQPNKRLRLSVGARRILYDYSFTNAPQRKRDPLGSRMSSLLVLTTRRIAQETRRAQEIATAEAIWYRGWRRRVAFLTLRCGTVYLAGALLVGASFALTGDKAEAALWGGLLLANAGPLALVYAFWMREEGHW